MKKFMEIKPYSVIFTSGTISIDMLENLLQIKFYKTMNNKHIINKNQFLMNIIENHSVLNYRFNHYHRNDKNQINYFGIDINNLAKSVKKGGILVFFKSYDYLKKCHDIWKYNNIFSDIKDNKTIIYDLKYIYKNIEDNIKEAKSNNNILLFTVYRGKNSEGINFKDDEARMVICVGIPYPNLSDLKIKLKLNFLEKRYEENKSGYDSVTWYEEEASVAVNQALGRLLRHKDDYGIMICFGVDFKNYSLFSKWINPNKKLIRLNGDNDYSYFKGLQSFLAEKNSSEKTNDIIDNENYDDKLNKCEESYENEDYEDDDESIDKNYKELDEQKLEEDNDDNEYDDEEQYFENEEDIELFIKNEVEDSRALNSTNNLIGYKRYRFDD